MTEAVSATDYITAGNIQSEIKELKHQQQTQLNVAQAIDTSSTSPKQTIDKKRRAGSLKKSPHKTVQYDRNRQRQNTLSSVEEIGCVDELIQSFSPINLAYTDTKSLTLSISADVQEKVMLMSDKIEE